MPEKVIINYNNIFQYTKNTLEYLFVDKAEVIPGKEAWGIKLASHQDWYYKMHFPGNPIMPGVFVMEAIMTTGSFVIYTMPEKKEVQLLFNSAKDVKMFRSVRPGDVINTHAVLERYRHGVANFRGKAMCENELVCQMSFTLIVPEEFVRE